MVFKFQDFYLQVLPWCICSLRVFLWVQTTYFNLSHNLVKKDSCLSKAVFVEDETDSFLTVKKYEFNLIWSRVEVLGTKVYMGTYRWNGSPFHNIRLLPLSQFQFILRKQPFFMCLRSCLSTPRYQIYFCPPVFAKKKNANLAKI